MTDSTPPRTLRTEIAAVIAGETNAPVLILPHHWVIADALLAQFDIRPHKARSEPALEDACICGHTFATHCTPELPNGGPCTSLITATPGYGCSCIAFNPARDIRPHNEPAARDDVVDRVELLLRVNKALHATRRPEDMTAEKLRDLSLVVEDMSPRYAVGLVCRQLIAWATELAARDVGGDSPAGEATQ